MKVGSVGAAEELEEEAVEGIGVRFSGVCDGDSWWYNEGVDDCAAGFRYGNGNGEGVSEE